MTLTFEANARPGAGGTLSGVDKHDVDFAVILVGVSSSSYSPWAW
ncbi:MAG TPA: hypothetical protein VMU34_18540 [Mycobacterium sp.]|nr:hypothetical protein [Mycobacterium sp.]